MILDFQHKRSLYHFISTIFSFSSQVVYSQNQIWVFMVDQIDKDFQSLNYQFFKNNNELFLPLGKRFAYRSFLGKILIFINGNKVDIYKYQL
jgi:succinylglutamate desuccinylase